MQFNRVYPLECGIQHYDWGCRQHGDRQPFIAELLDLQAEADTPYAELWIGAHTDLPATVRLDQDIPLNDAIDRYSREMLGTTLTERGVRTLPFLFKVLSCERSLSIQAHPDKDRAAELHARDPEHYPDANHKPEIAISLSGFDAMCGFRPVHKIKEDLSRLESLRLFFEKELNAPSDDETDWLKALYRRIYSAGDADVKGVLGVLPSELKRQKTVTARDEWFRTLLDQYPGDRGTLSAYFLNIVHLEPGQALYLPANEPHCYLQGDILECMANSNNVVRAGLTGKFIDVDVLLDMLTYRQGEPELLTPAEKADGARSYQTPAPEFRIDLWNGDFGEKRGFASDGKISLLLVTRGQAELRTAESKVLAPKGSTWVWPGELGEIEVFFIDDDTEVVRATANIEPVPAAGAADDGPTGEAPADESSPEQPAPGDVDAAEAASASGDESTERAEAPPPRPAQSVVDYSPDSMEDFGAYLEGATAPRAIDLAPGDRVKGVVTAVDAGTVFVDIGSKSDAVLDRSEVLDADGNPSVGAGDEIEAYCIGVRQDQVLLTLKMTGAAADATLRDAYEHGIPVEGRVQSERKGGFEVKVAQQRAFCPYSHIDMRRREADTHIGQRYSFLVTEYDEGSGNIVLSRRRLQEREREAAAERLRQTLEAGDVRDATVARIMPFGAFADLGGLDGLIPVRELSWERNIKPEDVLSEGDEVRVMVKEIDWERDRVTLSLKAVAADPWDGIEDKYHVGARCEGTVVDLAPFGAFVQLEPGIEGLVHISKLGAGRRINHPKEVVSAGDTVEVSVVEVDADQHRLSLSMEDTEGREAPGATIAADEQVAPGHEVSGTVDGIRDFGVFVKLPDGRTGLLHVSQIKLQGSTNPMRALHDMFPPGSPVKVVVQNIKGDRISLTLRETLERESERPDLAEHRHKPDEELGDLGNLLDGLDLDL